MWNKHKLTTQLTQKDKQVQVEPCPENARSFRSIGTQTGDVVNHTATKLNPDDITKLCYLEDHTYSLGQIIVLQQMNLQMMSRVSKGASF